MLATKNVILGYLILDLKSDTITISEILETGIMRKALRFQNIFGTCKKVV